MQFDDRLATVLQHRADGERMARVQFRQLIDLLGEPEGTADPALERAAFRRLDTLTDSIPAAHRRGIVEDAGPRLRNPRLVAWLAQADGEVGSIAVSQAVLSASQWETLIPQLPSEARAALRGRGSLAPSVVEELDRIDDGDAAEVPDWDEPQDAAPSFVLPRAAKPAQETTGVTDLGALVRRIEAFQQARKARLDPPSVAVPEEHDVAPTNSLAPADGAAPVRALARDFVFTTDTAANFDWVELPEAASLVGSALAGFAGTGETTLARTLRHRRPATNIAVDLALGQGAGGAWVLDAAPRFDRRSGTFTGYVGRLRRPAAAPTDPGAVEGAARIRQMLHELRTPVTAIQGFAEMIQQQTVGPVPHGYRALAAGIASDAARMLSGFAEIERLARLEAGQHDAEPGTSDLARIVRRQVAQLQTVLSPRVARIDCIAACEEAPVSLSAQDAETLAWRVLGTLAAATAAGETLRLDLGLRNGRARFAAHLPSAMAQVGDIFAGEVRPATGQVIATGLFGSGFVLRLARAEARAVGGDLVRDDADRLVLTLPLASQVMPVMDTGERSTERADL